MILIVKGGPVAVKEAMKTFGYDENENIAITTIVIGGDGNIGGTNWTVLGKATKRVTIKGIQLWPDSTELTWSVMKKNEKKKKVKVQPTTMKRLESKDSPSEWE